MQKVLQSTLCTNVLRPIAILHKNGDASYIQVGTYVVAWFSVQNILNFVLINTI